MDECIDWQVNYGYQKLEVFEFAIFNYGLMFGSLKWGVGTTSHGNHTRWLDLGFGCFQLWIWLCVILHYVMFE